MNEKTTNKSKTELKEELDAKQLELRDIMAKLSVKEELITKLESGSISKKVLTFGELVQIKCTVCNVVHEVGRQDKEGNFKPDIPCVHIVFMGVKKYD